MGYVALHGFGGGGTGLNFKVVGGTTQPLNTRENTIWINTDQKITSWIFSATEPTEPVEGMVWFQTGTSSSVEFDALKKNGILVYPISAKQYVSGAWVDVTAKSYQDGAWVDWWNGELFDNGNQYVNITGGWEQKAYADWKPEDFEITDNAIVLKSTASSRCAGTVNMSADFIKDYNTIEFHSNVTNTRSGYLCLFGIAPDYTFSKIDNEFTTKVTLQNSGEQVVTVDISAVDSGYILFTAFACTNSVTKIRLLK